MDLPFELETDLERRIAAEPECREGIEWGKARLPRAGTNGPPAADRALGHR